jgi:ubiquinone/menaquinone biosynthesis C-methylase UbiE
MPDAGDRGRIAPEVEAYYRLGIEGDRLDRGAGRLERIRTRRLLERLLPAPPATVVDVGGGTGVHAFPLARRGYRVFLVDPVAWNLERARERSAAGAEAPLAGAALGDARALEQESGTVDAVLLLGPLYHLTERAERIAALVEARRVLRGGGRLFAAAISRHASLLAGLVDGHLQVPEFESIVLRDLEDGQHRNPTPDPTYFTTAYFHRPEDLVAEVAEAGFVDVHALAIEGPGWLVPDIDAWLDEPARREVLMRAVERVETDAALLSVSAHVLAVADAPNGRARP